MGREFAVSVCWFEEWMIWDIHLTHEFIAATISNNPSDEWFDQMNQQTPTDKQVNFDVHLATNNRIIKQICPKNKNTMCEKVCSDNRIVHWCITWLWGKSPTFGHSGVRPRTILLGQWCLRGSPFITVSALVPLSALCGTCCVNGWLRSFPFH